MSQISGSTLESGQTRLSSQTTISQPWLSFFRRQAAATTTRSAINAPPHRIPQVEDFPEGYPRFASLVASHNSFHLCRRFSNLRIRLLLQKQYQLSVLEEILNNLDAQEVTYVWNTSFRKDKNTERQTILMDIDEKLKDYDEFLNRHHKATQFDSAPPDAVQSLRNWVDGNGCIARAETAYLEHTPDLMNVAGAEDSAFSGLEDVVERLCLWCDVLWHGPGSRADGISRDPLIQIYAPLTVRRTARILLAPLVTSLLLTPVIICTFLASLGVKLTVIVSATTGFIAILSTFTKATTVELVVAGATYTTVMVVFISAAT